MSAIYALAEEFDGVFAREAVARCVKDSYDLLQPSRIPDFLPLLAHRFARERLRAAAKVEGLRQGTVPAVLFVCTHNAGRSQLAAALLAHLAGPHVQVSSAGSRPASDVAPEVVTALAEIGVEAASLFPKPITDEVIRAADVVITMGCGDSCPVVPGPRYLDWHVDDPEGADEHTVRRIRDDIAARVRTLAADLAVPLATGHGLPGPTTSGGA